MGETCYQEAGCNRLTMMGVWTHLLLLNNLFPQAVHSTACTFLTICSQPASLLTTHSHVGAHSLQHLL